MKQDARPPTPPHFERAFSRRHLPDGRVKDRAVWIPDREAVVFHKRLLHSLYQLDLEMPHATGGIPGKGLADNITPHVASRHFYQLDISDAFPSVDGERLARQLSELGLFNDAPDAQAALEEFCLLPDGGLLQGAPSSPYLFNIYCGPLDEQLAQLCERYGLQYTRYLDDLTFSSPQATGQIGTRKRRAIREIVMSDGWRIAHHKSKRHSLDNGPVTITGLSLYPTGYWKLAPHLIEAMKQVFSEIESKLDTDEAVSLSDIGRLHGYHSVLVTTYDERRGQPTLVERELREQYQALRGRLNFWLPRSRN